MSEPDSSADPVREGVASRSFQGLLATQFLGAWNDNMFRWLAVALGATTLEHKADALTLGVVCFTIPYLLFAQVAGYLADRFDKRSVIVACKVAEILLMAAGIATMVAGNVTLLFVVVFLMGTQSALFAPAKFGCIPELVRPERISTANGLMGLITVVASALGAFAGYQIFGLIPESGRDMRAGIAWNHLAPATAALLGVAMIGWMTSLLIRRLSAADPARRIPTNPLTETFYDLRELARNLPLLRTALGIAFFWGLASLAQVNINPFATDVLGLQQKDIGVLMIVLVAGVGTGSVLAGIWSGDRVELGIVPLGALGIVVSSVFLYVAGNSVDPVEAASMQNAYWWSCFWLFWLGLSAGLFNVPLEAFMQHRSDVRTRGVILAASNFLSFTFILASAGIFYVMQKLAEMSPSAIFLVAGLGTLPVAWYVFQLLPGATIRFIVWLLSCTIYRVRVTGRDNLPATGGALLVCNHVSWIDGVLLLLTSSRPIRMLAYTDYTSIWGLRWLSKIYGVIPISGDSGPREIMRSLKLAREAVEQGELVCIFPEGALTRTGQLQPFNRGFLRIVDKIDAPVIPAYLDGLWGSIFSYRGGRFFWKRPRRWPYPVGIHFGRPMNTPDGVDQVRHAVQELGVEAVEQRKESELSLQGRFVRKCRSALFRRKLADSSGIEVTGGALLTRTLVLRRLLESKLAPDEKMVGILLPPAVGGVLANTAVSLMPRVAVNLNYTLDEQTVNYCIRECDIKHVITSRKFLEKRPYDLDAELIVLEDLKDEVAATDKLTAAMQAYLLPAPVLERMLGLQKIQADDLLTVIFTSGSTGEPKGVMLSNHNVRTNIDAVDQLFNISRDDVLLGVLPFFHSFGYTVTLWLTLTLDPQAVYHFNPLDARQISKLAGKYGVTILLGTPTFVRSYVKRCDPADFQKLDLAIVGAEKMPRDLVDTFQKKFGVVPTEGYGTTELSPVAAFNVPEHRAGPDAKLGTKLGTVGRVMPGAMAKVIHPETGEELGENQEGLLVVRGPNVMLGYLNQPEKTAEVINDGWYYTGDFARIDSDGFIEITGRQSRFSKIGGEMVPHLKIEEALCRIVEDSDDAEPQLKLAVTSIPDERKGERIVVLHRPLGKPVDVVLRELADTGLPNLWLPSADSFVEVEEIPLLGTGKLDLKELKNLALDKFAAVTS